MAAGAEEDLSSQLNSLHLCGEPTSFEGRTDPLANLLQYALNKQKDATQILPSHPFFDRANAFCQKYGWPQRRFENFRRLLCGIRNFPCILLLNPKNDHLTFDEMVQATSTLMWLQAALGKRGLRLDDIIIIELFPMLTDEWLDQHPDERQEAIREAFELTLDFIKEFKIQIILSCQCFAPFQHQRWGTFTHTVADGLRSSMIGAMNQSVSDLNLTSHTVHVIQGFHPAKLDYEVGEERQTWEELLQDIFTSSFEPCAIWYDCYQRNLQKSFHEKRSDVRTAAKRLHKKMTDYEEERTKAKTMGVISSESGSIRRNEWTAFKDDLSALVEILFSTTSGQSSW